MESVKPEKQEKPEKKSAQHDEDAIAVSTLFFDTGWRDPDFGVAEMKGGRGRLNASEQSGIFIWLLPRRNEYKIVEKNREGGKDYVVYVPRQWAAWVPA